MITNPEYGWCNFELGNFKGTPSYLTDVPVDLLEAFIEYHTKGMGAAWFDDEGAEFTLVITPYSLFIIVPYSRLCNGEIGSQEIFVLLGQIYK